MTRLMLNIEGICIPCLTNGLTSPGVLESSISEKKVYLRLWINHSRRNQGQLTSWLYMDKELLDQLERIVAMYERTREMELRKAELGVKIATDIMAQNSKSRLDMMAYFNQFVNPGTRIPAKEDE